LARQRDRGPPATILAPAALTQARSIKYQLSIAKPPLAKDLGTSAEHIRRTTGRKWNDHDQRLGGIALCQRSADEHEQHAQNES
jgi:hypothetical protein